MKPAPRRYLLLRPVCSCTHKYTHTESLGGFLRVVSQHSPKRDAMFSHSVAQYSPREASLSCGYRTRALLSPEGGEIS